MAKIVGIGACVFDTLYTIPTYPTEDTKMRAVSSKASGGGPVATGLVAAQKLGIDTAYLGVLSNDNGLYIASVSNSDTIWTAAENDGSYSFVNNGTYIGWSTTEEKDLGRTYYTNNFAFSSEQRNWSIGQNLLTVNLITYRGAITGTRYSDYYLAYQNNAWTMAVANDLDNTDIYYEILERQIKRQYDRNLPSAKAVYNALTNVILNIRYKVGLIVMPNGGDVFLREFMVNHPNVIATINQEGVFFEDLNHKNSASDTQYYKDYCKWAQKHISGKVRLIEYTSSKTEQAKIKAYCIAHKALSIIAIISMCQERKVFALNHS